MNGAREVVDPDLVLRKLHKESMRHRDAVLAQDRVGCFFCIRVVPVANITRWIDDEQTALCPHCDIDAILPYVVDTETLAAMSERWFTAK